MTGKNRQRSASAASAGTSADAIGTMASAAAAAASNSRRASGASGGGGSTDNLADLNGGAQGEQSSYKDLVAEDMKEFVGLIRCTLDLCEISASRPWRCPDPGCKKSNAGSNMSCSVCALPRHCAQQFQKKGKAELQWGEEEERRKMPCI